MEGMGSTNYQSDAGSKRFKNFKNFQLLPSVRVGVG